KISFPRTGTWPCAPMLEAPFSKENFLLLDAFSKKAPCKNAKKQHHRSTRSQTMKKSKKLLDVTCMIIASCDNYRKYF
ncbi:hypothetical protein M2306_000001, partial [Myroides gitamensis]|nr:hypothetical protein [Myroides gitamensis]